MSFLHPSKPSGEDKNPDHFRTVPVIGGPADGMVEHIPWTTQLPSGFVYNHPATPRDKRAIYKLERFGGVAYVFVEEYEIPFP